jgi:hypothetical protein
MNGPGIKVKGCIAVRKITQPGGHDAGFGDWECKPILIGIDARDHTIQFACRRGQLCGLRFSGLQYREIA